jgi:hypothetical protein
MASNGVDEQIKLVEGPAGYVLEDVPHLSDYILDLPVLLPLSISIRFHRLFFEIDIFMDRWLYDLRI